SDVYTVTATTALAGVTAVRLEVPTDDSLPHRGPGRQDNGNLHLNEFRVTAGPAARPKEAQPAAIRHAAADFDQAGWDVTRAIDREPGTAWGICPAVGRPHHAVFVLAKPVAHPGGTRFTFTLEQTHGAGHLIGRLRLAVTAAAHPDRLAPLPAEVARVLAVERTK